MTSIEIIKVTRSSREHELPVTATFLVDNVLIMTVIQKINLDYTTCYYCCSHPIEFPEVYWDHRICPLTDDKVDISNKVLIRHLTEAKRLLLNTVSSLTEYTYLSNKYIEGQLNIQEWLDRSKVLCQLK